MVSPLLRPQTLIIVLAALHGYGAGNERSGQPSKAIANFVSSSLCLDSTAVGEKKVSSPLTPQVDGHSTSKTDRQPAVESLHLSRRGFKEMMISFYHGKVELVRGSKISSPTSGETLWEGDLLRTRSGQVKIDFQNRAQLMLDSNSQIRFENKDNQVLAVEMDHGRLFFRSASALDGESLQIVSRTAEVRLGSEPVAWMLVTNSWYSEARIQLGSLQARPLGVKQWSLVSQGEGFQARAGDRRLFPQKSDTNGTKIAWVGLEPLLTGFQQWRFQHEETHSLWFAEPNHYLLISMIPSQQRLVLQEIPADIYVGKIVSGVFRLEQATAFRGLAFARQVLQRMIDQEIAEVTHLSVDSILEWINPQRGIRIELDSFTAARLHLPSGEQMLNRNQVRSFLADTRYGITPTPSHYLLLLEALITQVHSSSVRSKSLPALRNVTAQLESQLRKQCWSLVRGRLPTLQESNGGRYWSIPDSASIATLFLQKAFIRQNLKK